MIAGYTVNRKKPILSVDKMVYPGVKKKFSVGFTYQDNNRSRPMWKEFDNEAEAIAYINEIEKLIA